MATKLQDPRFFHTAVLVPQDIVQCQLATVSVDGKWSSWNQEGVCRCEEERVIIKTRTCTEKEPAHGGNECMREDGTLTTQYDRTEKQELTCPGGPCPGD